MSITEELLRLILGPVRSDIRPLVVAVEHTSDLLYREKMTQSDIHVTTDIYPVVAKRIRKKESTIAKSVERLAMLCWESLDGEQMMQIIGKCLNRQPAPREVLFYLAFYVHHQRPFYTATLSELFAPSIAL